MREQWLRFALRLWAVMMFLASPSVAAERDALVIGNARYHGEQDLPNARRDAEDMAATLAGLGFRIAGGRPLMNADRAAMAKAVNRFLAQVQGREGIALVYYAGHGMRDGTGATFLLPVDAEIEQEPDIAAVGVGLTGILDRLEQRPKGSVNLVIVDACRNNPFSVSGRGRRPGLGEVSPGRGTLVLYAASPGQLADENPAGRNGLFTERLRPLLSRPGLDIEDAFDQVSLQVEEDSGGRQVPWSAGNIRGKVYLAGAPGPGTAVSQAAVTQSVAPGQSARPDTPVAGETWVEPRTGMELVWVPGGTFTLGCGGAWAGDCFDDEKPARQVTLGGFWMGRHEVTQGQWRAVMGSNPSGFAGCDDCPVETVSWHDARAFISELDPAGRLGLGLPTEAQWEYACRGGGREETYCGGNDPDRLAWYSANSGNQTHPVGRKAANALGLHDMSGNVWEWTCSASSDAYGGQESRCVGGDDMGSARSLRGGSWISLPRLVRAADRGRNLPEDRGGSLGFRLARTITP